MKLKDLVQAMLLTVLVVGVVYGQDSTADSNDSDPVVAEIESTLTTQMNSWNNEDLDGFMQTYWKSDNLTFSSGGKTTRGWQQTLDNYKTGYPSGKMGQLSFDNLETTILSADAALVLGQWHLKFPEKNRDGNFSLVLRNLEGQWKIIHDHSSRLEPTEESVEE